MIHLLKNVSSFNFSSSSYTFWGQKYTMDIHLYNLQFFCKLYISIYRSFLWQSLWCNPILICSRLLKKSDASPSIKFSCKQVARPCLTIDATKLCSWLCWVMYFCNILSNKPARNMSLLDSKNQSNQIRTSGIWGNELRCFYNHLYIIITRCLEQPRFQQWHIEIDSATVLEIHFVAYF